MNCPRCHGRTPIAPSVGRRYRTRSGTKLQCVFDIRGIVADLGPSELPIVCIDLNDGDTLTYRPDGRFFGDGRDGMLDIVEVIDGD